MNVNQAVEKVIRIYFIRHGQSQSNLDPNEKSLDSPLTALGINQAEKLGLYFKNKNVVFDKVYSSTLQRAFNTADICLQEMKLNIPIVRTKEIVEWEFKFVDENNKIEETDLLYNLEESLENVKKRVGDWFTNEVILKNLEQKKDVNIAIFSHGYAINCFLLNILSIPDSFAGKIVLGNTSICCLEFSNQDCLLHSINDTRHLV
jgi:broad specificity phosphatase PhoE